MSLLSVVGCRGVSMTGTHMIRSDDVSRKNIIPSTRCKAIASARTEPRAVVMTFCAASCDRDPVSDRMAGIASVIARTMIVMTTIISMRVKAGRDVALGYRKFLPAHGPLPTAHRPDGMLNAEC